MKFLYLDPGLSSENGHHANSCREIVAECRRRGFSTRILVARSIEPALARELDAEPFFRVHTYGVISRDPYCGYLEQFLGAVAATEADLAQLRDLDPETLVYWNSANAAQIAALAGWAATKFQPVTMPEITIELGFESGAIFDEAGRLVIQDHRAGLFRLAFRQIAPELLSHYHFGVFEPHTRPPYEKLFEHPIAAWPLPRRPVASRRQRAGMRPVTVSLLGHQRVDKGFEFAPELVDLLLARHPGIRLLVHNGSLDDMLPETMFLSSLAANEPRLELVHQPANPGLWRDLLTRSDLIVLPYDPVRYRAAYSALAAEALANGIPMVVPGGTTLSALADRLGFATPGFSEWSAESVADAVGVAIAQFETLAAQATAASQRFQAENGASALVDALLKLPTKRRDLAA